jgi:hypothetical protein
MIFIYYLAAIGDPNFNIKYDILSKNLIYIYHNLKQNFDIIINCYKTDIDVLLYINKQKFPFLNNIYIHTQKGILVELWNTNPYHNLLSNYDYIFFILDDVEIISMDIHKLIQIKKDYSIDFISPRVEKSTWKYMRKYTTNILGFTNRIEIFCLLLTYNNFNQFLSINDINNPNTWGIDYILPYYKIKTAVYYEFGVLHKLPSASNHEKAIKDMVQYLKKHGFKHDKHIKEKYSEDIYQIMEI